MHVSFSTLFFMKKLTSESILRATPNILGHQTFSTTTYRKIKVMFRIKRMYKNLFKNLN